MSAVKPVKYDDANKKHSPFAEGDTLDPNAILIDPNSNNLLRSSDAGLMAELAAAPNVQNQYVSSSTGSDSNDGTEASPLKTIRYAVSRLPDNTSGTIYLKAGDVFKPEDGATGFVQNGTQAQIEAGTISVSNRSLSFSPYGDAQYDKIVATPGAVASQFDGVNQPIIVFTTCRASDTHFPAAPGFSWLSSTLEFNQIAVHITDPTGVLSAPQGAAGIGPFTVQSGTLRLNGNDMVLCNLAPVSAPVTSTASIAIANALVDTTAGKAFATAVGYRISFEYSDSPKYPSSIPGSNWRGTNINAAIGTTASFPGVTIISADARTYEGLVTTNKITQA